MLINLDGMGIWKNMLELGNNFESVLHVQSMGIDTSASFHHYFHSAHLFRYFQFIFTQSLIDCRFPKKENMDMKERKKKSENQMKWRFFVEEKGCLYYLNNIFTNNGDVLFIYLNQIPGLLLQLIVVSVYGSLRKVYYYTSKKMTLDRKKSLKYLFILKQRFWDEFQEGIIYVILE